jgi:hypothetical protein
LTQDQAIDKLFEVEKMDADGEYTVPRENRARVVQRGLWDDRLAYSAGQQMVDLAGLARTVAFLSVAISHDNGLLANPVTGYCLALDDGTMLSHEYPVEMAPKVQDPKEPLPGYPANPAYVCLTDGLDHYVTLSVLTERNGDLIFHRQ